MSNQIPMGYILFSNNKKCTYQQVFCESIGKIRAGRL